MTFLDRLNLLKCDFTKIRSGSKIIKFQQSQALTSHFESFRSIVLSLAQFLVRIEPNGSQPCCVITPFINGCSLSRVENFLNVENVTRVQPGVMSNTTEA